MAPKPSKKKEKVQMRWIGGARSKDMRGDVYYNAVMVNDLRISSGDCVLVQGPKNSPPYVARVDSLWHDAETNKFMFIPQWFYRPEDTAGGRLAAHLVNEVFETNHVDENKCKTIMDLAYVVSLSEYSSMDDASKARENVFVCRYHYAIKEHTMIPLVGSTLVHSSKRKPREAMMGLATAHKMDVPMTDLSQVPSGVDKFMQAHSALKLSAVPPTLPCRTNEERQIRELLEQAVETGKLNGCLYISGVPGTGKTATVQSVIRGLRRRVAEKSLPDFHYVEINAQRLPHPSFLYALVWEALSGHHATPAHASQLLDKRFKSRAGSRGKCCVLLVDELDHLVTAKQNVLYNLFDWPTKAGARLIVIGIANTMDLPERMLPRVTSRLGLRRVSFTPYTSDQISTIVKQRIQGLDAFLEEAMELVARKVAAASGDVRKALQIASSAAMIARRDEEADHVGIKHIQAAVTEMDRSSLAVGLKQLATHERLFIIALMLEMKHTGQPEAKFSAVTNRHSMMCTPLFLDCPPNGVFASLVSRLCGLHLITARGMMGPNRFLQLCMQPQDISHALREDPVMSRWCEP